MPNFQTFLKASGANGAASVRARPAGGLWYKTLERPLVQESLLVQNTRKAPGAKNQNGKELKDLQCKEQPESPLIQNTRKESGANLN